MASRQMLASLWATATTVTVGLGRLEPRVEAGSITALFDEEAETPQSSSGYSSDSGDSVSLPSSTSSSTSFGGPEEPWEEVEVCNGKWESRGILPGVSAWTPTNLDDDLLDTLTHARAACPRLQDEEDDVWETIMEEIMASTGRRDEAVAAEQVDDVLDWGVFIGWAPVPTLEEAEVLAAAAAAEEQQRREAAALKKAARLAKYHHNNGSFKRKYHYYQ